MEKRYESELLKEVCAKPLVKELLERFGIEPKEVRIKSNLS